MTIRHVTTLVAAGALLAATLSPALAQSTGKTTNSDPAQKTDDMTTGGSSSSGSASGAAGSSSDTRSGRIGQSIPQADANKPTVNPSQSNPKEFPGADQNSR